MPKGNGHTIVIDGHEFGAEDGLVISTERFEDPTDGRTVAGWSEEPSTGINPHAIWGASYAYSWHVNSVTYRGYALAAGNVYRGLRIVRVCFWYTRNGKPVSNKVCAKAIFRDGFWVKGPEATGLANDSLDPDAPRTIFNIETARIDPQRNY